MISGQPDTLLNLSLKKILNPFFEEGPSYILIHLLKNEVSVKTNGRKHNRSDLHILTAPVSVVLCVIFDSSSKPVIRFIITAGIFVTGISFLNDFDYVING